MILTTPRKTLRRAQTELHYAKDEEDIRQAGEKAWRAVREAVYAVLVAGGEKPTGTVSYLTVAKFEAKRLYRSRSRQPITDGYYRAMGTLHGECFYDGKCPSKQEMSLEMDVAQALIEQAELDVSALMEKNRRKR